MRPCNFAFALVLTMSVFAFGPSWAEAAGGDELTLSGDEGQTDKLAEALSVKAIDGELSEVDKQSYDHFASEATGESQSLKKEVVSLESQLKNLKDGEERSKKASLLAQKRVELERAKLAAAQKVLSQAKRAHAQASEQNKKLNARDSELTKRLKDVQIAVGETKRAIDQLNRENTALRVRIDRKTKEMAVERRRLTELRAQRTRASTERKRLTARAESSY